MTTTSTLRNERSVLSAMLGGCVDDEEGSTFKAVARDSLGRVRIDRDPDAFGFVLDYLRNLGDFVPPKFPSRAFQVLEREARYYGLEGLSAALADVRAKAEEGTAECIILIDGLPEVITDKEVFEIFSSLPRTPRYPFANPVALRVFRDQSQAAGGVTPPTPPPCDGRALIAFSLTAHAARAKGTINELMKPLANGRQLRARWLNAAGVGAFEKEEAAIMVYELSHSAHGAIPPPAHAFHIAQAAAVHNLHQMQHQHAHAAAVEAARAPTAATAANATAHDAVNSNRAPQQSATAATAAAAPASPQSGAAGASPSPDVAAAIGSDNPTANADILRQQEAQLHTVRVGISLLNSRLQQLEHNISTSVGAPATYVEQLVRNREATIASLLQIQPVEQDLERNVNRLRALLAPASQPRQA